MAELRSENFYNDLFNARGKKFTFKKLQEKYNLDCGFRKELQFFISENNFINLNEIKTKFNEEFKDFDFYFKIGIIKRFTNKENIADKENIPIKCNELISLNNLSEEIKHNLEKRIDQENSIREQIVKEDIDKSQYWIIHIQKKSANITSATKYAHEELAKSLGILNLLSEKDSLSLYNEFHSSYTVMEGSKYQPTYTNVELEEIFPLTDTMIDKLNKIENIFKKNEKNDIDKRIIKALDIYSQIQKSTEPIEKIVIYMTILENLLLHEDDKDYLNWKLADRVAFLIGNKKPVFDEIIYPEFITDYEGKEANSKYVINDFVKELYNIRSRLVHSSESSMDIDMFDKFLIIGHNIILYVITEFLDLEGKGITELKDKSNGLIKHLDDMKFNNPVSF